MFGSYQYLWRRISAWKYTHRMRSWYAHSMPSMRRTRALCRTWSRWRHMCRAPIEGLLLVRRWGQESSKGGHQRLVRVITGQWPTSRWWKMKERTCVWLIQELQSQFTINIAHEGSCARRRTPVVPSHGDPLRRARFSKRVNCLAD